MFLRELLIPYIHATPPSLLLFSKCLFFIFIHFFIFSFLRRKYTINDY